MANKKIINYWLFQSNPKSFRLSDALRTESLTVFPVKTHQQKIEPGDKVILWQTGKESGCYALAEVNSKVGTWPRSKEQTAFYKKKEEENANVKLTIEYNLWDRPLTKESLINDDTFSNFLGKKRTGTNYKATANQYESLRALIEENDMVHEPEIPYRPRTSIDYPLNLILYGPPGTGKTYHTINYALGIIENRSLEELALEDRAALQQRFAHYSEQGLIYFVTFHQAFSYEDFVEGIKPVTQGKKVVYEIQNGIFKHISLEAKRNMVETLIHYAPQHQIHIEFNALYKAFLEYLESNEFDSFAMPNGSKSYLHRVERYGNISLRREKSFATRKVFRRHLKKMYHAFPSVEAIENPKDLVAIHKDIRPPYAWAVFNELKKFEPLFAQQLVAAKESETVKDEEIQEFEIHSLTEMAMEHSQKFVLIIDEINRGNIASIFGDLISLIEPDKREGGGEALRLLLPYSKTIFCVPPNLHIIGTMNTADRSVEAMDIALRRRFTFMEMKPDPSVIKKQHQKTLPNGIDLEKLLTAINDRITLLLDKDFCIGHSYFLKVAHMADLQKVFDIEIIPLLQEYFFGDYGKIGLVLGKDFVVEKEKKQQDIFANFDHEFKGELADNMVYDIRPVEALDASAFIRIYDRDYE